ncbi:MAG: hypothetical protein QM729_11710 [Solirubrobacterales bacterium]
MQKLLAMRFGRRFALLGALTALAMGLMASTAFASVSLSPSGPYEDTGASVSVSGTSPTSEANYVAIAVCNLTVTPGERCDGERASELVSVAKYEAGVKLELSREFNDWNYTTGEPFETGTETECENVAGEGDECAVTVSFYKVAGSAVTQLTAEAEPITFE